MNSHLIILFVAIPMAAGLLNIALHRFRTVQKLIAATGLILNLGMGLWAVATVYLGADVAGGVLVSQMGNWPAPFGITVAVDPLAAVMLSAAGIVTLAVYFYSLTQLADRYSGGYFHALFMLLLMGINWTFITGDLFNMFVAFEIMLLSSYVLLCAGTTPLQMRQAYKYVLLNLLSSTLFVMACGMVYGHTGTLNMAELTLMATQGTLPASAMPAIMILLLVFASKTAAFPIWYWLPDSYPTMPAAMGGLFSGLLTKVGVYTIIRVFVMIFGSAPDMHGLIMPILLVSAGGTMFLGVIGAVSSNTMRRLLSIHVISQVGYMVLGVGLATELAIAAALFHVVHNMIVKSSLFLCCGLMERYGGTDRLDALGGLARRDVWLATLFFIAAISLAGLPPSSGFFGKLLLIRESFFFAPNSRLGYILAGLALATSVLTLLSMLKIWSYSFWSKASERVTASAVPTGRRSALAMIALLVVVAISLGLGAGEYLKVMRVAARNVLDPTEYVAAVLGDEGRAQIEIARIQRGLIPDTHAAAAPLESDPVAATLFPPPLVGAAVGADLSWEAQP